ncbi:N-acetylmuramoyl-L-alanine amidase [bacterium]|nr:N-acetylmuramoyl-L-alanine amidase [bacterium]
MICPFARFRQSPHHDARDTPPRLVLLHYTATSRLDEAARLLDQRRLSAHFLVGPRGALVQMVATRQRAWHAGVSNYRGATSVNGFSIGIEIVNPGPLHLAKGCWQGSRRGWNGPVAKLGEAGDWAGYPLRQVLALLGLLHWIGVVHPEAKGNVCGHEDVAPGRKVDPGPAFPWARLKSAGWPRAPAGAPAYRE